MSEIKIVAVRHPFTVQAETFTYGYVSGETVEAMMERFGFTENGLVNYRVNMNGCRLSRELWPIIEVVPGTQMAVRAIPMGGGGGGGKDPMRTVLTLAVIAASMVVAPYVAGMWTSALGSGWMFAAPTLLSQIATGLTMAAITMGGMMAVNALCPPARPAIEARTAGETSVQRSPSLTGGQNRATPYGPIPKILGRHRVTPPYAARPYTEVDGDNQYLRLLFVVGYGPLAMGHFRIGETAIENFDGVEMEVREGWPDDQPITLFSQSIIEDNLNVGVKQSDGYHIRTTHEDAGEITVELTFPTGLVEFDEQGNKLARTVEFEVSYALKGTGDWKGGSEFTQVLAQTSPDMPAPTEIYGYGDLNFAYYRRLYRVVLHKLDGSIHIIPGPLVPHPGTGFPKFTDKWYGAPTCPSWAFPLATVITSRNDTTVDLITAEDIRDDRGGTSWTTCIENPDTDFKVTSTDNLTTVAIAPGAYRQVLSFTAATAGTIRKTVRIKVDKGQYDVRVKRLTPDSSSDRIMDESYWTALRTIRNEHPVQMPGLALVAMRIRASDRLQGMVDEFNLVAESIIDDYDAATGTWVKRFSNIPASLARHILQGPGNKRAVGDDRIDIPAFEEWHDWCVENGWRYNQPIDFRSSVNEILREVFSAGRAAPSFVDGKYTVIMDKEKPDAVQMFTPHNSWGFSAVKRFNHLPHGLRVQFFNEETDWKEDEGIVYADGYSKANATNIEGWEVPGVTNWDLIWKHGRRMLAEAKLRPEEYTLTTDVENLVCTRGDKVLVEHDVTLWGLGSGRLKSVIYDGDIAYRLTTDEALTMEDSESYNIRIRKQDGSTLLVGVVTEPGTTNILTLAVDLPAATAPEPGDTFAFGYTNRETNECLVKSIEPQSDLTATLKLVDYSPGIFTADAGPIPAFTPNISIAGNADPLAGVGTPIITNIRSDETVLLRGNDGTLRPRVLVSLRYISNLYTHLISGIEVQWRPTGHDGPWEATTFPYVTELDIQGVETGGVYDFRLRYRLTDGRITAWALRESYTVIGTSTKPPNLPGLMIQGSRLSWEYPAPPLDHDGFIVRFGNTQEVTWETGHPAHLGVIKSNSFDVGHLDKGTKVFMVKAVDRAKNESVKAARLVTGMGDNLVTNAVVTYDMKADGFPGVLTNCEVDGEGNIAATANASMFWGQDDALFWGQPNDFFYSDNWKAVNYEFQFTPNINDPLTGNPMNGLAMVLDYAVAGDSVKVEYRTTGAGLFWGPDGQYFWGEDEDSFWGPPQDWQPWPGRLENVTRQPYQFRITTREGLYRGKVTALSVILDAEDQSESIQDLDVSALGTRLPITKSYSRITGVRLTLQDDGGTAVRVVVADKDPANGPLIKAYDKDGVATTATIDADVQGFKGV